MFNKDKMNILEKTQENLELSQKNNQMLAEVFADYLKKTNIVENNQDKKDDDKKKDALKAAYALNLCTVSVSQIIDYNDIYFLEREYDAILNNLDLEKMPKDEALLRILKQLLDVITFFRIQEGDRKMMEKEYEQRMKDAVWSAIPNPSMIVAGGSPVAIAVSLATQVGTGYMNYRKEKAKINQEKERKEWELQRSALEQFNGLRRELFDTAWRLADEYNFPDEYRITERQITQYNSILLDSDDLRRYERLEYISAKFQAYPPFWYYLGNAANLICQDESYPIHIRELYKNKAVEHFDYFFKITEENLLREDQLIASCALEMFDLVEDKNVKMQLLEKASTSSGNAFDVLQLCAISYLKIGEIEKSCNLLKMLVNENYNEILNAQLLSRLYVSKVIEGDEKYRDKYFNLERCVSKANCLFPMPEVIPETDTAKEALSKRFVNKQRDDLLRVYSEGVEKYINKCENDYNGICRKNENIVTEMAEFIRNLSNDIEMLVEESGKIKFLGTLNDAIKDNKEFYKMIELNDRRVQGEYVVSFEELFRKSFVNIIEVIVDRIKSVKDMSDISILQSTLNSFLIKNNIIEEYALVDYSCYNYKKSPIEEIFGEDFTKQYKNTQKVDRCLDVILKKDITQDTLVLKQQKMEFIKRSDTRFVPYLQRNRKTYIKADIKDSDIVAILNDTSKSDTDLIFTSDKVYVTGWFNIKSESYYKDIDFNSKQKLVIGDFKYNNSDVNLDKLKEMIDLFAQLNNENKNNMEKVSLASEIRKMIRYN